MARWQVSQANGLSKALTARTKGRFCTCGSSEYDSLHFLRFASKLLLILMIVCLLNSFRSSGIGAPDCTDSGIDPCGWEATVASTFILP